MTGSCCELRAVSLAISTVIAAMIVFALIGSHNYHVGGLIGAVLGGVAVAWVGIFDRPRH